MANDILKFADTATNILTQVEYAADAERNSGNIPGVARSKLVNKVLRQCAFVSNAFAAFLVQQVGGDVLDDNDSTVLLAKITSTFTKYVNPNLVINGNFDIWQVNSTFNVSSNKTYTADQFFTGMSSSTSVVTRQNTDLTESFKANYFKRSTVTSVANAASFNFDSTPLENVRVLAGKEVTLSFWAKADSSKNISIEMVQNFGTGGSPSSEVQSIGVNKIALTTSWQKIIKKITLPSISGKTIGSAENSYTGINWWFDAGSNFSARTDTLGQQSGTFDIAQIKLEYGHDATEFVLSGNSISGELLNCQRFYVKTFDLVTFPAQNTGNQNALEGISSTVNSLFGVNWMLPVQLRAVPTVTTYSTNAASANWSLNSTTPTASLGAFGTSNISVKGSGSVAANSNFQIHATANARL